MFAYDAKVKDNLNRAIKNFPNISPIAPTDHRSFDGISRLVMLDRYSQKDKFLTTLTVGDIVVTLIQDDTRFPSRGIGQVIDILEDGRLKIQLEEQEFQKISQQENDGTGIIIRSKDKVEKPLEIFYEQISRRVGKALAKVEKKKARRIEYQEKFATEIANLNIVPAGRVLYGAGSDAKVTYFNCYVMPNPADSRGGISRHREEVMEIMSRGGGVGTNGSSLRPRGTPAISVGGHSSGSVSWLNDLSQLTHLVEQGGSRRGAQMIMLCDWHPDIIEFIISKMQNENVLRWIVNNMKDRLILEEANRKVRFVPLTPNEKEMHQAVINARDDVSVPAYEYSLKLMNDGGRWEVVNSQFLTGANISVAISDDFMHAVKNKGKWQLRYPDIQALNKKQKAFYDAHWHEINDVREWEKMGYPVRVYYEMDAVDLWDLINFCATYSAEPGVFFIDTANQMTNAQAYGQKIFCTNPCGEQPLVAYSVCNLSAINLANFVDKATGNFKRQELVETVRVAVRLQDNITDATPYFLPANKKQALGERRIGLGIMGLHDMLIWSGKKYGSKEGNSFVDLVMSTIAETAYRTSLDLAVEKKPFPFLKRKYFKELAQRPFIKTLPSDIADRIIKKGIRNSHLLTIAPTGSTGTMVGVSTGLEPYFAFEYYRSGRLGKMVKVKQAIVTEWLKYNDEKNPDGTPKWTEDHLPDFFVKAMDLKPEEHAQTQITIQRWVDSSISKTVNAPKGFTVKQVEQIFEMLYDGKAKGGTVYVDGSRDSQVLTLTNEDEETSKAEQLHLEIDTGLIPDAKEVNASVVSPSADQIDREILVSAIRGDRQDRNIGVNEGDNCPECKEGVLAEIGGCTTCTNCGIQWKCGL
ncbi:vitamin B12-dependent ribonucleotide reductase [[Mycoplasma] testudinis]|uniref:vitamin B12-dependent ribonucleotide reductase n=1 Tax=[Mycoplasma] testudinis TaxID=33924 RepID=UPI000483EAAE|nr:vitamin B12-dependent ribonucleotide reductase [[Mycoplasma] testudinis]